VGQFGFVGQTCPPRIARRKHSAFSRQLSARTFSRRPPSYLRLSVFICGPYGFFANSANALQSNQAAEIVAPREEFRV
jgi:hypothetical protein